MHTYVFDAPPDLASPAHRLNDKVTLGKRIFRIQEIKCTSMRKSLSQSAVSNTGLHESIEQLYAALEKYPLNCKMNGSPLYHDLARWNQVLSAKSLRNLSVDDLRIYYFKAMTTWGDINDFKHFLPRIFELLSELPVDFNERMALSKLDYGSYKSWPDNEKSAVFKFLSAFWRKLLTEESDVIDAYFEGYFLALANIYPDFNQMLQIWLVTENQFADRRLANFVCKNHKKLLKKRLAGHEEMVHQGELFFEWLRSPVVLKKLKQALPSESYPYLDLELITVVQQFEKPI